MYFYSFYGQFNRADVNFHSKDSRSALETVASWTSSKKCFDLLIRSGADVNKVDLNGLGRPLIIWVAGFARPGYLDSLIKAGADVNAISAIGDTALLNVVFHQVIHKNAVNHLPCVKLLLRAGANVNICNLDHHNPLTSYIVMSKCTLECLPPVKEICMVLFAAGEKIRGTIDSKHLTSVYREKIPIPDYLLNEDLKLCLKHMCREAIRKHLLEFSNLNLFCRMPRFTLPSHLRDYLMYFVSIDDEVKPEYNEDSGEIVVKSN